MPVATAVPSGPQAHRVPVAARHGVYLAPFLHVAGSFCPPTNGHDRAVAADTQRAPPPGRDPDHVAPGGHVALAVTVPPRRRHRSVGAQADGVRSSGVARSVHVAGRDGDDVGPACDVTLPGGAVAGRDDRPVVPQS